MAISRIFQCGFELNNINEADGYPNDDFSSGTNVEMVVSTTKFKRGARSARSQVNGPPRGKAFAATQIRAGFFINHTLINNSAVLAIIPGSFATPSIVYWDNASSELRLRVNGSTVDAIAVAAAGFATTNVWYHIGVTYKADAATGFFSVYLDGVQILTYSGNTGTAITGFYFGGNLTTNGGWDSFAYFDDLTIDDATGESDAPVPSPEYMWQIADGAGANSDLSRNTGSNNWEMVDDTTPDDDTTYVYADADGVKDSYTTSNITRPAGYTIAAKIPTVWARKTDAGADSQWKLGNRSNGGTESLGSGIVLGTGYKAISERQTLDPDGSPWTETTVNNSQVVIESEGTF